MKKIVCFSLIFVLFLNGCFFGQKIKASEFIKQTKDITKTLNAAASGHISGVLTKTEGKNKTVSDTDTYFIKDKNKYTYTQSFSSKSGYSSIYTNGKEFLNFNGINTKSSSKFNTTPSFLVTLSSIISQENIKSVKLSKKLNKKIYKVTLTDGYLKKIFKNKNYTYGEYKYTLNKKGELISYTLKAGNKSESSETVLNIDTSISKDDALKKINEEKAKYRYAKK